MVNKRINEFYHKHPSLILLVVLIAVVIPGYISIDHANEKTAKLTGCVTDWANGYQTRSEVVLRASTGRQDALDAFLRSLSTQTPPKLYVDLANYIKAVTAEEQQRALEVLTADTAKANEQALDTLNAYKEASDHYNEVITDHPLQQIAQRLEC